MQIFGMEREALKRFVQQLLFLPSLFLFYETLKCCFPLKNSQPAAPEAGRR